MLEDNAEGRNAVGVTEYFAALYDANYRDGLANDGDGKVIFFEGARITLEAHMVEYPAECHDALRRVLTMRERWRFDRIIVLTTADSTPLSRLRDCRPIARFLTETFTVELRTQRSEVRIEDTDN